MTTSIFRRDGLGLHGADTGEGRAVVFQHGLGGDEQQVAEVFPKGRYRRLTLECRAQGQSEAGDPDRFSITTFADDVLAFAKAQGVARFAAGGISMGAAIALRIACIAPERVTALILARPAWSWLPAPANMQVFVELASHLRTKGISGFEASETAKHFAVHAPDNLASLRKFFGRPDQHIAAELLTRVAQGGPDISEAAVCAIRVPTLIIANGVDLVHPLSQAQILASAIPNAQLVEITPKALDRARHAAEFRSVVSAFLESEGSNR